MTRTTPSPECARLAAALRELKARTGLSLAGLAERTTYSKSSWDRYLGGKALPPRQAVQDLCRLAREPDGRCLALWEIAESEWSGRATETRTSTATGTGTPPSPPPPPSPQADTRTGGKGAAAMTVLASVCAVVVGSVAVALFLWPRQDVAPQSSMSPSLSPSPSPSQPSSATGARCRGAACEGQNPLHMRCGPAPATLAEHRTATGARLELRYSKECGASWARMWGTRVGDRLEMTAGGPTHSAEIEDTIDAEAYVYTPMTATGPGTVVRACFRPATDGKADGKADGKRECFDSRVDQADQADQVNQVDQVDQVNQDVANSTHTTLPGSRSPTPHLSLSASTSSSPRPPSSTSSATRGTPGPLSCTSTRSTSPLYRRNNWNPRPGGTPCTSALVANSLTHSNTSPLRSASARPQSASASYVNFLAAGTDRRSRR